MNQSSTNVLAGMETAKVVFDINVMQPQQLTSSLMVIRQTVEEIKSSGVKPEVVIALRGVCLNFVSTNRDQVAPENHPFLDKIAEQIAVLKQEIRIESCSVAAKNQGIENSSFIDGITPVNNTFISLIAYQANGYVSIRV